MSIEQAIKGLDTLGERLRIKRERLGWTQDEMASYGAVSCPSQKLYEYGKRAPSLHYLYMVSEAGADAVFLLCGEHEDIDQRGSVNLSANTLRELFSFVCESSNREGRNLSSVQEQAELFAQLCVMLTSSKNAGLNVEQLSRSLVA